MVRAQNFLSYSLNCVTSWLTYSIWACSCRRSPPPGKHHVWSQSSRKYATGPSGFRLIALNTHIMKTLDKLVLSQIRLGDIHRPLTVCISAQYLCQWYHAQLDTTDASGKIIFFNFSSAFNTRTARWEVVENAGGVWTCFLGAGLPGCKTVCAAPKLCVWHYSLQDRRSSGNSSVTLSIYLVHFGLSMTPGILFSSKVDSAVVVCIRGNDEEEYRSTIRRFVDWCDHNHLKQNISKTKEMVIDFRKKKPKLKPVFLRGHLLANVFLPQCSNPIQTRVSFLQMIYFCIKSLLQILSIITM